MFDLLKPNTTVLTPTSRLSAAFMQQFHQQQQSAQKISWESFDILPISSWLERSWLQITASQLTAAPLLLKPMQESILWEEIIRKSAAYDYLLQKTATADLAKSAWDTLKAWQVTLADASLNLTDDSQAFQKWAIEFNDYLQQQNWLDKSSVADYICQHIIDKRFKLPAQLMLIGFTELSPHYKNLFTTCENSGCHVIHYQAEKKARSIYKIRMTDEENEIRSMARWAKAIFDEKPDNKPYYIGCVVPNLDKLRSKVSQIFCETFSTPDTFTFDNRTLPFNITAGQYLLDFPVIRTAFDLLSLHHDAISLEQFSNILRSPFLGDAEAEQIKRAYFETRLRTVNAATLSLTDLLAANSHFHFITRCPKLAKRLAEFHTTLQSLKKTLPLSEHVKHIMHLLSQLGWPGERRINSFEFQVIDSWLNLLNEFSTFDQIMGEQTFSQALYYLNQITAKKVFQPKTPDVPIQILGLLEAVALPFEHLWVMGLDDTRWPPPPKPNPLIPQKLQKKLHMPHATAEREFLYCQQLMQQLAESAENIIYSYPSKNDETDLQPSSLLNDLPELELQDVSLSHALTPLHTIFQTSRLETLIDTQAPPLNDQEAVRGGTHIFKLQAACPFKAFAELRLHARQLETPTLGLRAMDRGNIVHKALEKIWQQIKTSDALLKLSHDAIRTLVSQAAMEAIAAHTLASNHNQRYFALEQQRLEKILLQWLHIEMDRPAFTVIKQEYEHTVTLGKIVLTVRVDRIDQLADGSELIIDYKTGKNNDIQHWFSDRPQEPQLPLYCVTNQEEVVAIAFAQLHPSALQFTGVSKRDIGLTSIKLLAETHHAQSHLWNQQLEEWRKVLEKLANDFYQGKANVDPKKEETCLLCNLQPFCRIHEKA